MTFSGDADYVRTRWLADPKTALGAEIDGKLVGSNFATRWGSLGFFGPLSVEPQWWDRGIGVLLMKETLKIFEKWGTRHDGARDFDR